MLTLALRISTRIILTVALEALATAMNDLPQCRDAVMMQRGVLPTLTKLLLKSDDKVIKEKACCIIFNITAGTKEQIGAVILEGALSKISLFVCRLYPSCCSWWFYANPLKQNA